MEQMYGLSYTLKIHIIQDHLGDRLRKTGKTLLEEADEHTENVHHRLREFKERHNYGVAVRNVGAPFQKIKQHNMLSHWNGLNK